MVKYMQSSKQRRDFIDVTKFALSILIVVIHISPIESLNPVLRPFLRTAVPLFFLISAYLFFKKYGEAETIEKKIARIERYVKRNLQLYFFWLIVLLIPTLSYRQWFTTASSPAFSGPFIPFCSEAHSSPLGTLWQALLPH